MSNIQFIKTKSPKQKPDNDSLGFGNVFSDHMFVMDYSIDKGWHDPRIIPYGPFEVEPSMMVFHYGQAIFEGLKAYRNINGDIVAFRPLDNIARLNYSAERLCIPKVDEELVWEALKKLLEIEKDWVPDEEGTSLYIRPFIIATDPCLGVRPSYTYKFLLFCHLLEHTMRRALSRLKYMLLTNMYVLPGEAWAIQKLQQIMRPACMQLRKPRKKAIPRYCGWMPAATAMSKR